MQEMVKTSRGAAARAVEASEFMKDAGRQPGILYWVPDKQYHCRAEDQQAETQAGSPMSRGCHFIKLLKTAFCLRHKSMFGSREAAKRVLEFLVGLATLREKLLIAIQIQSAVFT